MPSRSVMKLWPDPHTLLAQKVLAAAAAKWQSNAMGTDEGNEKRPEESKISKFHHVISFFS